eukprot:TRINITY_DN4523_c0_g1_i1.p1 TRINITY_DN4523_c0_g1~~TRINITY_DN4523_c0_g1_i1.p1  ORF type:complete len:990 (+),score=389.25 TRINITY_DN4523_c0_g1_i1:47-3016(+)
MPSSAKNPANTVILHELEKLDNESRTKGYGEQRFSPYRKAIISIKEHPDPITNAKDAIKLKGVGAKIAEKIEQILKELSNDRSNSLPSTSNPNPATSSLSSMSLNAYPKDVVSWLQELNLSQYIPAFEEAGYDNLLVCEPLPNIEMNDAFTKFREQIKCYSNSPSTLRQGLEIIQSTHTDFFSAQQKSEFMRLKGEFLWKLGQGEEANQCYSTSIQTSDTWYHSWLSWGKMCDHQFGETKDLQWAEHAISCYLQAARGTEKSRSYLARALYLLDNDDENERLMRAFEKGLEGLPLWIWVVHIPFLIRSFKRAEGAFIRTLHKVSTYFPQGVYFPLRTFYKTISPDASMLVLRKPATINEDDMEVVQPANAAAASNAASSASANTAVSSPAPGLSPPNPSASPAKEAIQGAASASNVNPNALPGTNPTGVAPNAPSSTGAQNAAAAMTAAPPMLPAIPKIRQPANFYVEDLLKNVQTKSQSLLFDLENLANEIVTNLAPTSEEILHTHLQWCITQVYSLNSSIHSLPDNIKNRLKDIAQFNVIPVENKNYLATKQKYGREMETDFGGEVPLESIIPLLKKWILRLEEVIDKLPKKIPLKDLSPFLAEFQPSSVEIPGQYFNDNEPSADLHVRLDRIISPVHVFNGKRIIQMRGTNGKIYHFMIETDYSNTGSFVNGSQERAQRLFRGINKWISNHRETRRRNIYFHIPNTISLSPTTRLVQIPDVEHFSLDTPYKKYCLQLGQKDTYSPQDYYRAKVAQKDTLEGRLNAYHHISVSIPDEMFKKYTESLFPSPNHFFAFRKQSASQLAVHSLLSYILGVKNALPENLSFFKSTGSLLQNNFFPLVNEDGKIDCDEPTPFRLSRNMSSFLGNLMVDGTLSASMTSTSLCLIHHKEVLRNQLSLYLRDELVASRFSEPEVTSDKKTEIEWRKKVISCVEPNVDRMMEKLNSTISSSSDKSGSSASSRISKLLENAQQARVYVQNNASWQPWI